MDFLRPVLLWGLAAVAVPILIHLLGRRRARPVPVATLRFLERARARASARLKLRRVLLLMARVAALAGLALLYAGPGCRATGGAEGPATWLLLLDTSPSMAASRSGPTRLDEAKKVLFSAIDAAGPEDRFLFTTTREGDEAWRQGFSADLTSLRRTIRGAQAQYGVHRIDLALENAFAMLEGVEGGRVVLATDLQASAWGEGTVGGAGAAALRIADVGLDAPQNTWVGEVEQVDGEVQVRLGFSGAQPAERHTVSLSLGEEKKLTAFLEGDRATFHVQPPTGVYSGEVRVEPGGDLKLDDTLFFAGQQQGKTRVLLVNGDPWGFEIRDELLFVRRALAPDTHLDRVFEAREVRLGDLETEDLEDTHVVLLANPGALSPALSRALLERVEEGMGLVVSAGDRWKPETSPGEVLSGLLAAPLRDVIVIPPDDPSRRPFEPLDPASLEGPMDLFADPATGDLAAAKVRKYWVLDARTGQDISVWMRLENGTPLLVERRVGKGRTLLLATTVDRDGADLCLQPAFIPWLERLLLHSAGRLRPSLDRWAQAGRPFGLPYEGPVGVEGPEGQRWRWASGGDAFVPPVPGIYRIVVGGEVVDAFAATLDPAESDLTPLPSSALDASLGSGNYVMGEGAGAARGTGALAGRRDASAEIAVVVLFVLLAESILSARWRRKRRAWVLEPTTPT